MKLYSYLGKEPTTLPERVRLENGETRTSLHELDDTYLASIGFIGPIEKPEFNSDIERISWTGKEYVISSIIGPQPFPSWSIVNAKWEAPVPYPTDGKIYNWNEELGNWIEI